MDGTLPTLIAAMAVVSLIPFLTVTTTCFTKIVVILLILRNALGIQQTPPNLIIYTLSVIVTLFIMAPTFRETYAQVATSPIPFKTVEELETTVQRSSIPIKAFLTRHVRADASAFFLDATRRIWPEASGLSAAKEDLVILVPAFLLSELTRAFETGFLLYIPFLLIDFVVSVVLVAIGMQMLSPNVISTPFKLLLFVAVDGWSRLVHGLILSYATG
jgi:type III secretion protein R